MGSKASVNRESLGPELFEPLLRHHGTSAELMDCEVGYGPRLSSEGSQSSVPASFKALRPRKTKDFIGSVKSQRANWDVHPSVDPGLLDDADTTNAISAKVASLIFQYIEEGNAFHKVPLDPEEDEFHEANFLFKRFCCCPRRSSSGVLSVDTIFHLLNDIASALFFCKQVVVLCAVYVERLLDQTSTKLTSRNWRSIVVVSLLIASKVWEDIHPWNADFEDCLYDVLGIRYRHGALYRLESIFLEKLRWRVFVDGEVYAAYFFSLLEGQPDSRLVLGLSHLRTRPVHCQSHHKTPRSRGDSCSVHTIDEDEIYAYSPSNDLESCVVLLAAQCEHSELVDRRSDSISPRIRSPKRSFSPEPWSRDALVSSLRLDALTSGSLRNGDMLGCCSHESARGEVVLRAVHECWRLEASNPFIGALRHAPRALAPSRHIPQSEELLWAHELALKTAKMLGPRRAPSEDSDSDSAHSLSGATGSQLASELRRYLEAKKCDETMPMESVKNLSSINECFSRRGSSNAFSRNNR
jgi:hypothetical protein